MIRLLTTSLLLPMLLVSALAGCKTATVTDSVTATLGSSEPDVQLDFWHELAGRPITSNDDAFHGLLLYLDDTDANTTYDARVTALKSRGLLPGRFEGAANQAVTRGTLAYALCKSLGIKGGLMMHLTGGYERYAVRELMYQNLYPNSSVNQTFTGTEFLGIIGRMEDYQRGNPANVPAAVMPADMNDSAPATQPSE